MATRYTAPKAIATHVAVAECLSAAAGGSDYKHDVLLREGWAFARGRMAGCRSGFFHTVKEFHYAHPVRDAQEVK